MLVQKKSHLPKTAIVVACFLSLTLLSPPASFVRAQPRGGGFQDEPGTRRGDAGLNLAPITNNSLNLLQGPKSVSALSAVVTATGLINYSIDGAGYGAACGTLQVNKPAGATVRNAYLLAASTGFSGATIANGEITLNGTGVTFSQSTANAIGSTNYFGEVTSIVKPVVDAAAAGIVNLAVCEGANTDDIEGEILVVIFDDPAQTMTNSFILLFGAQNTGGDTFNVTTSPLNPANAIDFSLGITFGFQGTGQASTVTVNGTKLTSAAGGQDDGEPANGALVTVGGVGDSNANPADPNAGPNGDPRFDDELYNLAPFVTNGATSVTVDTLNASGDDNIMFAGFFFRGATASIPPAVTFDVCLQDDSNPNIVLQFNSQTGEFQFCCSGQVYTGTGTVMNKGNISTLQFFGQTLRVNAKIDRSVNKGSAALQSPLGVTLCTITDRNTTNNTCVCVAAP